MTEIPEHLLRRSKERRQAMGLGGETPDDATPAQDASEQTDVEKPAAAAAPARAEAPAAAPAPVAPPDPPYVVAAKQRKKVPMWAAPVLAVLPLWGFIYYHSLQKPPAGADDPLALGAEIYNVKGGCAGCHGADGSGGVGPKLTDGEALKTFKNPLPMVHWIAFGADGGARDNGTYGDLDRPGGPQNIATLPAAMPAQKDKLTPEEIAAVTLYVRQELGGGEDEKDFSVAEFATLEEEVEKVIEVGPGGDPKVAGVSTKKATKEETESDGEGTSGSSTDSAGGSSGAGSSGGSTGDETNSSGGAGSSGTNSSDGSSGSDAGGTAGGGG